MRNKCIIGIETFGGFRAALQLRLAAWFGSPFHQEGDMVFATAGPGMPLHVLRVSL